MIKSVKLSTLCKMQSGGTPSRSNLDYYEGDLSCELIIIEPDEPVKSKEPVKPKIYKNPYFKY